MNNFITGFLVALFLSAISIVYTIGYLINKEYLYSEYSVVCTRYFINTDTCEKFKIKEKQVTMSNRLIGA